MIAPICWAILRLCVSWATVIIEWGCVNIMRMGLVERMPSPPDVQEVPEIRG
jgi:hypothetical protein